MTKLSLENYIDSDEIPPTETFEESDSEIELPVDPEIGTEEDLLLAISDESSEIDNHESQLLDSILALEKIYSDDGVSRSTIASFESYLPENYPLASFTKSPTKTNFDVAVISLEERNWTLIISIASAVIALIGKIIHWLMGTKERKSAEVRKERLDKLLDDVENNLKTNKSEGNREKVEKHESLVLAKSAELKKSGRWSLWAESCAFRPDKVVRALFNLRIRVLEGNIDQCITLIDTYKGVMKGIHPAHHAIKMAEEIIAPHVVNVQKDLNAALGVKFNQEPTSAALPQIMNELGAMIETMKGTPSNVKFELGKTVTSKTGIVGIIKEPDMHSRPGNRFTRMVAYWEKESKGIDKIKPNKDTNLEDARKILGHIRNFSTAIAIYLKLLDGALKENYYWMNATAFEFSKIYKVK